MTLLSTVEAGDMQFGVLTHGIVLLNFFDLLSRHWLFLAVSGLMVTSSTSVASKVFSSVPLELLVVTLTVTIELVVNLDFVVYPVFILAEAANSRQLEIFRSNHAFDMD
jgi:hypothetical protein